ncbi:MAG: spermine synthase, partial [Chloroflexi bacterium]|nr:spermine synthase [Chloroflexota bacterium]
MIVLSHYQATPILQAMAAGKDEIEVSLDLGLGTAVSNLTPSHINLPDGQTLTRTRLEEICNNELASYLVQDNDLHKVQYFSDTLNRHYSLMPTESAPTMLISGITMHRIKHTNPHLDTLEKIKAAKPVVGNVLDT